MEPLSIVTRLSLATNLEPSLYLKLEFHPEYRMPDASDFHGGIPALDKGSPGGEGVCMALLKGHG